MDSKSAIATTGVTADGQALAEVLLRENREELAKADAKTSMLLATATVVVGVLLAGMLAGDWTPAQLRGWAEPTWWLGAACALGGLTLLMLSVAPRGARRSRGAERACYFGDIASCTSEADVSVALNAQCKSDSNRTLDQLLLTSRIIRQKYALIRWSLGLLGLAVGLTILAILANH